MDIVLPARWALTTWPPATAPPPPASSAKQQVRRMCERTWPSESARTSWDLSLRDIRTDKDELQESVPVGAVLEFLVQSRWRPLRAAVSAEVSRSSPNQPSQSWRAQITGSPAHWLRLRKDSLLRMSRRRQFWGLSAWGTLKSHTTQSPQFTLTYSRLRPSTQVAVPRLLCCLGGASCHICSWMWQDVGKRAWRLWGNSPWLYITHARSAECAKLNTRTQPRKEAAQERQPCLAANTAHGDLVTSGDTCFNQNKSENVAQPYYPTLLW